MDEKKKRESGQMKFPQLPLDNQNPEAMVHSIIAAMQETGADEDTLLKTRKLMEAKFGIGSWSDVIAFHEETLQEQEAQNDIDGQLQTLIQLIEYAINDGDKEKARQFVLNAEGLLEGITAVDIEAAYSQPASIPGETILQIRRAEIERLHNWVF